MGRKKPFIDKKNADTFQLINRSTTSQDANAPPVFLQHGRPKDITKVDERGRFEDEDDEDDYDGKQEDNSDYEEDEEDEGPQRMGAKGEKQPEKYRSDDYEWGEYGFPDDGYDYTKHFKPTGGGGVYIPATTFDRPDPVVKAQKESERILERIDPEILAALNDELEEEEEELQEDFVDVAGGVEGDPEAREDHLFGSFRSKRKREPMASMYTDYEEDEFDEDDEFDDEDEENERRGKRVPQTFLEEKFEAIEKQYDDDELGELDEDDPSVRGTVDISAFADVLSDYLGEMNVGKKSQQQQQKLPKVRKADGDNSEEEDGDDSDENDEDDQEEPLAQKKKYIYQVDEEDPEFEKSWKERVLKMVEEESEKPEDEDDAKIFETYYVESVRDNDDCESVLSTYTNTENHPRLLIEPKDGNKKIKISSKTGIPLGVFPTRKKPVEEPPIDIKKENLGKARAKETLEEKRARKKAIKSERKDNRERKKHLKSRFQKEELRQKGLLSTNRVQPAVVF